MVGYVNSKLYRSDLGSNLLKKYEDIDLAAVYFYNGKYNTTTFSLRSLEKREESDEQKEIDVSKIAELYGGGGHPCASGITLKGVHVYIPSYTEKLVVKNKN